MKPLHELGVAELGRALAAKEVSSVEITTHLLARMAEAVGGTPVRLTTGAKPAYHAAAVLAAGGFDALLDAIAELGRVAGLDEAGSLAIYGGLIEQTLGNARSLGIEPQELEARFQAELIKGEVGAR